MASAPAATTPILAQAAGHYFERAAAPALAAHFSRVWFHRVPADAIAPIAVVPDASIDLQWIDGALRVAGPDRKANIEPLQPGAMIVGFRFRIGAAPSWLRVGASGITGTRLSLGEFWGNGTGALAEWASEASTPEGIARRLETALAARVPDIAPPDRAARAIYSLLRRHALSESRGIAWLGDAVGMSERTLRRRSHDMFGYGPKTLDRIFRFQRFLGLARGDTASSADLAIAAGYADQAHLTRESREMAGLTPATLLRQLRG